MALLLPAIAADGGCVGDAALELNALCAPAPNILHLAESFGCASTVAALQAWASSVEVDWQFSVRHSVSGEPVLPAAASSKATAKSTVEATSDTHSVDISTSSGIAATLRSAAVGQSSPSASVSDDYHHKFERMYAALLCLGQVVLWARTANASATDHMHQALLVAISLLFLGATTLLPAASYRWHRAYLIPLLRVGAHTLGSQRSTTVSWR